MIPAMALGAAKEKAGKLLNNPYFWVVAILLILFFIFRTQINDWMAKNAALRSISQRDEAKVTTKIDDEKMQINLKTVADGIYNAFHDSSLTEDEDKAIALIKSVPREYVHQVAYYYALKGKDMYEDFRKYLRKEQYAKVSSILE